MVNLTWKRLGTVASVALLTLAALLLAPAAEASRSSLPAALAPALTSPAMPTDIFQDEAPKPQPRLRLFADLSLPERPLGLVEAQKTASGAFTLGIQSNIWQTGGLGQNRSGPSFQGLWTDPVTGIAYARNRWYDARTASWLSEDPMGSVDSPNLYAFVGWGPHAAKDPMGRNLVEDPNLIDDSGLPHYMFGGGVYRISPHTGVVWRRSSSGSYSFENSAEVIAVISAMAGVSQADNRWAGAVVSEVAKRTGGRDQRTMIEENLADFLAFIFDRDVGDVNDVRLRTGAVAKYSTKLIGRSGFALGSSAYIGDWGAKKYHAQPKDWSVFPLVAEEVFHSIDQQDRGTIPWLKQYLLEYVVHRIDGKSHLRAYESLSAELEAKAFASAVFHVLIDPRNADIRAKLARGESLTIEEKVRVKEHLEGFFEAGDLPAGLSYDYEGGGLLFNHQGKVD